MNKLNFLLACILFLGMLGAHAEEATSSDVQPSATTEEPAYADDGDQLPASRAQLTFMDSKLFDAKLGKEMEAGKEYVEVTISGRVPLSNIPPRIDRWVVKSAEEGKVELLESKPKPKTRFLFGLIPLVFNAVGIMKNYQEERMFNQARKYDTKIYYKKDGEGDTLIEKIVFTKRESASK